ncbi:DoxX family protein [Candidatus Woesearchaeota archaeon]|nr:DoxX family protein [Candidatus Woesearchaeota archaeon]
MCIKLFRKCVAKCGDYFYFVFRIFVGVMFFMHGAQKLFGWFSDNGSVKLVSLMGVAGVIEVVAGLAITLGLLTRLMALISAVQMVVAYFMVHFPQGWVPLQNKGELALLYFAAFLVLLWKGAGKWNLDSKLFKKEVF